MLADQNELANRGQAETQKVEQKMKHAKEQNEKLSDDYHKEKHDHEKSIKDKKELGKGVEKGQEAREN